MSSPARMVGACSRSCGCAGSASSTTPSSSSVRASPRSPARPARARRCCSPVSACCSAAGVTRRWSAAVTTGPRSTGGSARPRTTRPWCARSTPAATSTTARCCSAGRSPRRGAPARSPAAARCRSACSAELAESLVAVHGQADQRGLLRPAVQRATLDRFAGPEAAAVPGALPRDASRQLAQRPRPSCRTSARGARERAQEADLLRLGLAEVQAVAPAAGEDVALRAEIERLGHVDLIKRVDRVRARGAVGARRAERRRRLVAARCRAAEPGRGAGRGSGARRARPSGSPRSAYLVERPQRRPRRRTPRRSRPIPTGSRSAQQRLAALAGLTRKYAPDVDGVLALGRAGRAHGSPSSTTTAGSSGSPPSTTAHRELAAHAARR